MFDGQYHIKLQDSNKVYDYTSGLKKLLAIPVLNVLVKSNKDITNKDVENYIELLNESGSTDIRSWAYVDSGDQQYRKLNTALQKIGKLNEYFPNAKPYTGKGLRRGVRCGKGFKFLTSDPKELLKKLDILIAEKLAGNTNILPEASAIVDELRRLGELTLYPKLRKYIK